MLDFFREGGWGMYPVLVIGLVLVWGSGRYALDGEPVRVRFITAAALALIVFSLEGMLTDVATVFWALSENKFPGEPMSKILLMGLKESSRPGILGFLLLGLALVLVTIGVYRVGRREIKAAKG